MVSSTRVFFLIAIAALAIGCRSGRGRPTGPARVDSGPGPASPDARVGGEDAGVVIRLDAGPRPDGGSIRFDAGPPPEDCPPVTEPLPAGRACTAATWECVTGATTGTEAQACIDADVNAAACDTCVFGEIISCATTTGGCSTDAGLFVCCLNDNCAGLTGTALTACVETSCSFERDSFQGCITASGCSFTEHCFAI
jgi:hypothetical protein